jgi:protein PhnA
MMKTSFAQIVPMNGQKTLNQMRQKKKEYMDAHGNILNDGDTVTLIKDLKVKGSFLVIKGGAKIKNIRPVDRDHDIDYKVDGQSMLLKLEFMKKSS